MMATHRNVAAVMAVLLSTLLTGCPGTPMDPDADSGNNPMTDGGVPDGDSGPDPLDDGGMDSDSGSGPMTCTPTESDPLCAGADECECDLSDLDEICTFDPVVCQKTEYRNVCAPGRNRCGDDMPMAMDSYNVTDFPPECEEYLDNDIWSNGSPTTLRGYRRNAQWMFRIGPGSGDRTYACSFDGWCYYNWSYEESPDEAPWGGEHGRLQVSSDCQRITGEFYYSWHGGPPDETFSFGFQEFGAT